VMRDDDGIVQASWESESARTRGASDGKGRGGQKTNVGRRGGQRESRTK